MSRFSWHRQQRAQDAASRALADTHQHVHSSADLSHAHPSRSGRTALNRLLLTLAITVSICVAEVVGGYLSGSLALLSDAGHMLTDILALLLSLFALIFASRPADARRTYGYYRLEIISAFLNGLLLFSLSAGLLYSAWLRSQHPKPIEGGLMMVFAAIGLAGNVLGAYLLAGLRHNVNLRAAFLHVLSDGVSSVGVLLGSFFIYYKNAYGVDIALSVLIAILIVVNSLRLLHESTSVLMESIPPGIDLASVRAELLAVPGVSGVHDLHIWSISSDISALSAHIVVSESSDVDSHGLLAELHRQLAATFKIMHTTIQVETVKFESDCAEGLNGRSCA